MREYPAWKGNIGRKGGDICEACHKAATQTVNVAFGYLRGTDWEAFAACQSHAEMARNTLGRFLAHINSKPGGTS